MRQSKPRPSIRDVARLAGVSHQTVSRVVNGHPSIRASTRERVLRAIETLGYRPNAIARALATAHTSRIGVFVDSPTYYGPMGMFGGFEVAARDRGFSVTAITGGAHPAGESKTELAMLLSQGVEALCLITPRRTVLDEIIAASIPLPPTILVASLSDERTAALQDAGIMNAAVDQGEGVRIAIEHLLELGHRGVAHVAGPADWLEAGRREDAWRETLASHGLDASVLIAGDWSAESGYRAAPAILAHPEITAVLLANDEMALGLVHGLVERGVRVPEDLSVVGFDDLPGSRHYLPPLTTVRQDFTALGRAALERVLEAMRTGAPSPRVLLPPELVVRASTATLRPRIPGEGYRIGAVSAEYGSIAAQDPENDTNSVHPPR